MAYTYSLLPTRPDDTNEKPSLGAGLIRSLKLFLVERLNSWVYGFDSASTEIDTGLKYAPLIVQDDDPSTPADSVRVYAKDVNSTAEMFVKDESGNEIQITNDGEVKQKAMQEPTASPSFPLSYDCIYNYYALYSGPNQSAKAHVQGYIYVKNGLGVTKNKIFVHESTFESNVGSASMAISFTVPVPAGYSVDISGIALSNLGLAESYGYATQIS